MDTLTVAFALAVLCSAATARATTALAGTPPYEVTPGARERDVPLNAQIRVFGTLGKTPDAGWALFTSTNEEVPCEARVTESAHHRTIELLPRELLAVDAGYTVRLLGKDLSRFSTGARRDTLPPTTPVLSRRDFHAGSLLSMTTDWWELLGTPSTDDSPGLRYLVSLAPADAGLSEEADLQLTGRWLPRLECVSCVRHIDPKNFDVRVVAIDLAGHRSPPATWSEREPKSRAWRIGAVFALASAALLVVWLRRMRVR